jgi:hypothetical protein
MEQQKHNDNSSRRNALHSQFLDYFFLLLRARKGLPAGLLCCHPTGPLREAFYMGYPIPILSQFESHYKMVLILSLGLILLVLAGAGRLHADNHTKA